MANEITAIGMLSFAKSGTSDNLNASVSATLAGSKQIHARQSIGTSEEAIQLAEVTAGGWFLAINRDATNFISLKSATGVTPFAKLSPGEFCLCRLHPSATAPYAQADTAPCELEYLLLIA